MCELDIIFNFHKAYYILDEIFIGGQLVESSKRSFKNILVQDDINQMKQGKEIINVVI